MSDLLPLLDISPLYDGPGPALDRLAAEVDRLLQTAGFLMIVGHRVPESLVSDTRALARDLFHQPDVVKATARVGNNRGWVPTGYEATGYASGDEDSQPDLKESFTTGQAPAPGGPYADFPSNVYPSAPPGLREGLERYVAEMLRLGSDLLHLFALALGLPADHLQQLSQHPASEFNLNWYPALDHIGAAAPNQFRIGPHTDYGCLTILDREPGAAGLQIRTLDGEWVDAPVHPGSYTVNIADLLARLTGERWRSTPHRVLPPSADAPQEELISLVFFHEFSNDAVITTLPAPIGGGVEHPPVVARDYLLAKFAAVTIG